MSSPVDGDADRGTRRGIGLVPALLGLLSGLAIGCSTLADPDAQLGCQSDDECADGKICAVDTGQCVNGVAPPRGALGFAITEGEFTVELAACDAEVSRAGSELVLQPRAELADQLNLTAVERVKEPECVCDFGYECNEDLELCEDAMPTRLELRQRSRLGRGFIQSLNLAYPIVIDEMEQPGEPVQREWAHYDAGDPDADLPVVMEVLPDVEGRARFYRALLTQDESASDYELEVESRFECSR